MLAPPRFHVISSTAGFNPATNFTLVWEPQNNANLARLNQVTASMGRFNFKALLRSGLVGAILMARAWQSTVELTVRSANTADYADLKHPDDPLPEVLDTVMQSAQLTQEWSRPLLLGPTDAVTLSGGGARNTVEMQIFELQDQQALAYMQAVLSAIPVSETVTVLTVGAAGATLDPWTGTLIVLATPGATQSAIVLPAISDMATGSKAFIFRVGGGSPVTVSPDGADPINGAAQGIELGQRGGESFEARESQWLSSGHNFLNPSELSNAVNDAVVPLPTPPLGIQPVTANFTARGTLQLPPIEQAGFGCGYAIQRGTDGAAAGGPRRVLIIPEGGESLNGIVNNIANLGEPGSIVYVLKANVGVSGEWYAYGDRQVSAAQVLTFAVDTTLDSGWVGEKWIRLTQAGAQTLTLPPAARTPIGCVANVVFEGAAGGTLDGNGTNIRASGAAAAATLAVATLVVRRVSFNGTNWIAEA